MQLDYRSIPYRVFDNTARILTGFVFLAIFQGGTSGISGLLVLLVLMILVYSLYETAYVQAYEYRLDAETVDIKSGVVSKREREIPFERIQNVDIAQNAIQRALGIAEVRLETAGGGDSEARLRYVSRQEATRLQELISRRKRGDRSERDPGAKDDILFELSDTELGILGITSANVRLLGLLSALVVFGSPLAAEQVSLRLELLLFLGPALAVVALVLLWAVSGAQAVLRYYGFRLLRHDEELRYERGLLQRYNGTIPLSKIQTLMIRENVLARSLGYGSLAIETAGYAPGQDDEVESAVPIAKRERVFDLARTIEDIGEPELTRPPKQARRRYMGRYTILVGLITGILGGVHYLSASGVFSMWYLAAALWVFVPPAAHLKWINLGYYFGDRYVITQSGFWSRRTTIVPYYRIQTVASTQSIFQRRHGLATLVVDTASSGGFWGGDAIALDIDETVADDRREDIQERFQESIAKRKRERAREVLA